MRKRPACARKENQKQITMREIIEYPHLLIPIVISLLSLLFLFYKRKQIILKTNLSFLIALVLFFAFYLLIVSRVLYLDIHLQSDLSQYDLNNDGVFNGEEINEKQKIAMNKVSSDTSRNFSFITALIFSLLLSMIIYVISILTVKIKNRLAVNPD